MNGQRWQMGKGAEMLQDAFDNIWLSFRKVDPKTPRETFVYSECLARLSQLSDDRRQRLHACGDIIPPVIWFVLWIGAILPLDSVICSVWRVSDLMLS